MCETIKPSSWDQGGILRDIFTITRTVDNAVDAVLDSPAKMWDNGLMNQIIYNSFPRSGNVYSGSVSRYFFNSMNATVHIPEIFSVKELDNVTIFRKPEDAISSLINQQSKSSSNIEKEEIELLSVPLCELYRKYINYAKTNNDLIYIGKFENLVTDTIKHFENVAKKFQRELLFDYKNNFKKAEFSGKLWDDRYDGHVPRPKDNIRIDIEEKVRSLQSIQELNKEYEDFINVFETKI